MWSWRNLYYRIVRQPRKIVLAAILLVLALGYLSQVDRIAFYARYHEEVQFFRKLSNVIYLPYAFFPSKLERYDLIIPDKKWGELDQNLPPTYQNQLLTDQYKDTKSAVFRVGELAFDVNVRYRGDTDAHWRDPQKSWFIDFKKEAYFENKEEMHLVIPVDRKYLVEELNFYRARKMGLTVPETKFVNFFVNGKRQGVYWMLEGASKDLLERQNLPGDVNFYSSLDFTEPLTQDAQPFGGVSYWRKYSTETISPVDSYSDLQALLDVIHEPSDTEFAKRFSQLVDVDEFLQWEVQQHLATSQHQTGQNMRFYFDITRGKFVFMPWDISMDATPPAFSEPKYNALITRVLSIPEFLHRRNQLLWQYVGDPKNLEDDLRHYDELDRQTKVDFLKDNKKVESNLAYRAAVRQYRKEIIEKFEHIKADLEHANAITRFSVQQTKNQALVTLSTNGFSSIALNEISFSVEGCVGTFRVFADSNVNGELDSTDQKLSDFTCEDGVYSATDIDFVVKAVKDIRDPLYLTPGYVEGSVIIVAERAGEINLIKPEATSVKIRNAITGQEVAQIAPQFLSDAFNFDYDALNRTPTEFTRAYPQFRLAGGNVVLPAGTHVFDRDVIVPPGTRLIIEPGVTAELAGGVSLFSKSPIEARGTAQAPILFRGRNGATWGSFSVIDVQATSTISFVYFEGGKDDYLYGTFTIGMLSIYHSPAVVEYSTFTRAHGDDGMNVKYGYTEIRNNRFIQNDFDGLDLDVTYSVIEDNIFERNGNDGIDISSLKPTIRRNRITGSGDKCISVGENSQAILFNNILDGCNFGFAAKDYSSPLVINNTIINNNFAFGSYQKKQIFGGARPIIVNSILWGNKASSEMDAVSQVDIIFSTIQTGWEGEGNLMEEPVLENGFVKPGTALSAAGSVAKLKELLGIERTSVPMGAIGSAQ